ncbi:MAG: S41 family peptidase [Ignavibacteria bacterium]|nr:S41 family peptidase [Ignavibacteria bacterium]
MKNPGYIIFLLLIILFTGFAYPQSDDDIYNRINKNMDIFGKAYKEITLNYVDNINADRFIRAGIEGMFSTLDPYTVYYDETNKSEIDLITAGKFGGVGLTIELRDSIIIITDIMTGYEAERKGLRTGDIITEIDGVDLKYQRLEKVRTMVRGEPGTKVLFRINRNGEIINFYLTRQEIILKNVSYYGFIGNESEGTGYIKLDRFTSSSVNEFENSLKNLKSSDNLKCLIIDLRGNGGGLLEAAIGILNKIIPRNNLLLITKGRNKDSEEKFFSNEEPIISEDIPVAILINKYTASASEIVAGAIQDLDRGIIVGTKSLGKGLVQQIKDLSFGSMMKLTNRRYYTPSGRWIQEKNYFKENKYGVFVNNHIYEQKEFKTLNGRTVYAYGGITPDVEIHLIPESDVYLNLLLQDAFFKFANYYLEQNPGTDFFTCTDEIFSLFKNFLFENDIFYTPDEKSKLKEFREITEKKSYENTSIDKYITDIEAILNSEAENEFEHSKDELKRAIEIEINKRLFTEENRIKASFNYDTQLKKAISVLKEKQEYDNILNIK